MASSSIDEVRPNSLTISPRPIIPHPANTGGAKGIQMSIFPRTGATAKWRRRGAILIWSAIIPTLMLTYYVNHYMPHGPSYSTGDYACENDDRGPCHEVFKEDAHDLNIPAWAKFVREDWFGVFLVLFIAGALLDVDLEREKETCGSSASDDDEEWFAAVAAYEVARDQARLEDPSQKYVPPKKDLRASPAPPLVNELIERAAKALARCAGDKDAENWRRYVPAVRTVLEALDEPTSSMIDAGNVAMRTAWAARGLTAPAVAGDAAVAASWEAMIDNALGYA